MEWFTAYAGTVAVGFAMLLVVALIIRKMVRSKRAGKSFGCECAGDQCALCMNANFCTTHELVDETTTSVT